MSAFSWIAALCFGGAAHAQEGARAAAELNAMCRADAARLWGVTLCGPLLIGDPGAHMVWASAPDGEGRLAGDAAGWVGPLAPGLNGAHQGLDWAGVRWIVAAAPLPQDAAARRVLLAHQAWHRVQGELALEPREAANAHLTTEQGRTLMRLELRALATALRSRGGGQMRAARDALALRAARHAAFAEARAEETALDRNEGLAAYTGVRLGADEPLQFALRRLDQFDRAEALAGSYALASGPAYGLLLDLHRPNWRAELGGAAPADLLALPLHAGTVSARDTIEAAARYGRDQIAADERARAEASAARLAALQTGYAGPRLELPLRSPYFDYDPNGIVLIEGLGVYYQTLTLRDAWGELYALNGALVSADGALAVAAAPGPDGLSGPGWRLTLASGWRLAAPRRDGVWRVAPTLAAPE